MNQVIIVEKNEAPKINIEIVGTKVVLEEEMTLDWRSTKGIFDVNIDICTNRFGFMMFGVNERYVLQIAIPARTYETVIDGTDEGRKSKGDTSPYTVRYEQGHYNFYGPKGGTINE